MKEPALDEGVQDAVRQMQKLMATLSAHKDSISRATSFAVMHAKRGGAGLLTEVIANRLEEVLSPLPSLLCFPSIHVANIIIYSTFGRLCI